jgi:hypothetical protein
VLDGQYVYFRISLEKEHWIKVSQTNWQTFIHTVYENLLYSKLIAVWHWRTGLILAIRDLMTDSEVYPRPSRYGLIANEEYRWGYITKAEYTWVGTVYASIAIKKIDQSTQKTPNIG